MLALTLLAGLAPSPQAHAQSRMWHVATDGSDATGDGSPLRPYATLQHAIDAAAAGDTVIAQPGVYKESINYNGKDITVGSLFLTTGSEDYVLNTVIDGGRNGHVVSFQSGETAAAVLVGLTITNGYAAGEEPRAVRGGGIFCWETPGPTLTHLRVVNNEAVSEGGGLFFAHCAPVVRNVYVAYNRAGQSGGGVRYSYGSIDMENVAVVANSGATGDGGGMHLYHADGHVRNALIVDNLSGAKGGGLGFDGCSPTFTNVTIAGNRTSGSGGGLDVSYMSAPALVNAIVWGNVPEQIDFDTRWFGQAITIDHSDIQGGQAGIVTNGLGPVHWSEGNLDLLPLFAAPSAGNYRLSERSPAIGAGTPSNAPATDIDGAPRPSPAGSQPDMGAYEHPLSAPVAPSPVAVFLPGVMRAERK